MRKTAPKKHEVPKSQPSFIFTDECVFHPQLTDDQIAFIYEAKKYLDELQYEFSDYNPEDTRNPVHEITSFDLYFKDQTGYWTRNELRVDSIKSFFVHIWFYGVSWRGNFKDQRGMMRLVTYSVPWKLLEKQYPVPTVPPEDAGKGTSRIKKLWKKLKECKRDANRRIDAQRAVKDRREDRQMAKRAARELVRRNKALRNKRRKMGSGSRIRRKRTISIPNV